MRDYRAEFTLRYENAVRDLGPDLGGHSVLDLMADNFPELSLEAIKAYLAEFDLAQ